MNKNYTKAEKIVGLFVTYIIIVLINIFAFAHIYDNNNYVIRAMGQSPSEDKSISFGDSIYFSGVTYLSIGYGDIIPVNKNAQVLVLIQGFSGMMINSIFGGAFLYYLLKRPTNILLPSRLHIRYDQESKKFYLCIRIGNKGRELVNVNRVLELFIYENGSRERRIHLSQAYHYLDNIIYWNIDLHHEENAELLEYLKYAIFDNGCICVRILITGYDTSNGELAIALKYYTEENIIFIKNYYDLYRWKNHKRSKIKWQNFDRANKLEKDDIERFRSL